MAILMGMERRIHKYPIAIKAIVLAFVLTQITLYALMHVARDTIDYRLPSFLCVLLCLLFAVYLSKTNLFNQLAVLALLFTVCADYFLVLFDDYYLVAMLFFNVTQILYAIRVYLMYTKTQKTLQLYVRVAAIIIVELTAYLMAKDMFDALVFISVIYFCNLAVSAIFSVPHIKKQPMQTLGLFLFLMCDICVWANNASGYMNMPAFFVFLMSFNINIMWVFYAPSQVLLALSTYFGSQPTAQRIYYPFAT